MRGSQGKPGARALRGRLKIGHRVGSCLMAALFIGGAYAVAALIGEHLMVASLGASAFIAFAFPAAESARPRYLMGGYLCGAFWGVLASAARSAWINPAAWGATVFLCAAVVFLTALSMSLARLEHPPAVALAIAVALSEGPWTVAAAALAGMAVLCACKLGLMAAARRTQG